jgi:CRP-like cAMP-binding protein
MMDAAPLALSQLLEHNPLFASMSVDEATYLHSVGKQRTIAAGEQLFASGSPGDALFIVLDGTIHILMPSQDGDVFVERFQRGELLGEIAVLDDQPRTATAMAAAPSALLVIQRDDFLAFLERFPSYRQRLITILVQRLRRTSDLVAEMLTVESGVVLPPDQHVAPSLQTTIVGYGRYGNHYIGPKYAKRGYPWEVVSVVDPLLTRGRFAVSVLGRSRPDTLLFRSFQEWYDGYFAQLAPDQRALQVVEIPLKPDLLYDQLIQYIDAGVKQLILPKPVVMNHTHLRRLIARVTHEQIKAAVASQWYYSDFPRIIQRELQRLAAEQRTPRVHRVEIEFSKEHGLAYATPPPLLELPHVLQLLDSIGLVDVTQDTPDIVGTQTMVALTYHPKHITDGVYIRASTDYHPPAIQKHNYPNWDYQQRTLNVYFDDDPTIPRLMIDFWIKFIRSGDIAIRPGQLRIYDSGSSQPRYLELHFVEDQLLNMNRTIYETFAEAFEHFQRDPRVLSLERYRAIGEHLMAIQEAWERCTT